MNLWLRLLFVLLTAPFKKRAGLFDTTVLRLRVLPNDLDFNGHVNNGRYFTLADLGRVDYVIRSGSAAVAWRLRAAPIVGDATAKFRKDLRPFQAVELHSRLLGWHGKWTFMEHRFVTRGRVAGVVTMRGLFVAKSGPVAPEVFLEARGLKMEAPALPESVLTWSRSCDLLSEGLRAEEQLLQDKPA